MAAYQGVLIIRLFHFLDYPINVLVSVTPILRYLDAYLLTLPGKTGAPCRRRAPSHDGAGFLNSRYPRSVAGVWVVVIVSSILFLLPSEHKEDLPAVFLVKPELAVLQRRPDFCQLLSRRCNKIAIG